MPGLRFFYDGQFEGRRVHTPVQLGAARDEPTDPLVSARYRRLLAIVDAPVFHAGEWRLCEISGGRAAGDLAAWRWSDGGEWRLVVVNLGAGIADGFIDVSAVPLGAGSVVFEDLLSGVHYDWAIADLAKGLYVRLDAGAAHVFTRRV